jgi:hypothetical protein
MATRRARSFPAEPEASEHLRAVRRVKQEGLYEPKTRRTVGQMVSEYMNHPQRNWKPNSTLTN